jgi:hypothetical protein
MVTTHEVVPEHPLPVQPANVEVASGTAVRVTAVPLAKSAAQTLPQEMLSGLEVTAPIPVPSDATVSPLTSRRTNATPASAGPPPLAVP